MVSWPFPPPPAFLSGYCRSVKPDHYFSDIVTLCRVALYSATTWDENMLWNIYITSQYFWVISPATYSLETEPQQQEKSEQ